MRGTWNRLKDWLLASREKGAEAAGELLGETVKDMTFTGASVAAGILGQVAPALVSVYLDVKRNQFETRMQRFADTLTAKVDILDGQIRELTLEQQAFIENRMISFIIDRAMEEEQESKIELIVNGFVNIVELGLTEEDKILSFYDILKELRYQDIQRMLQIWQNPEKTKEAHERFVYQGEQNISTPKDTSKNGFIRHIDKKLEGLALVRLPKSWDDVEGEEVYYQPHVARLTAFGVEFLTFFKTREE